MANKKAKNKPSDPDKKTTSLRLEKRILKQLKIKAIEEDTSVQKIVETLILDYLKHS